MSVRTSQWFLPESYYDFGLSEAISVSRASAFGFAYRSQTMRVCLLTVCLCLRISALGQNHDSVEGRQLQALEDLAPACTTCAPSHPTQHSDLEQRTAEITLSSSSSLAK